MTEQIDNQPDKPTETNQTKFTFEEPLFEAPPSIPVDSDLPPRPWYRRPKVLIIGGGSALILFVLALMLSARPMPQVVDEDPEVTVSPLPANLTPLEQRINALKTELQAADPSKQEFPFPPVDMELQLASPRPQQ